MKFIVYNLRMIWARLSNSGWVLAELFLVFIVMWFLCDSLGCMKYTFYRPLGYDIDHVYRLTTVRGGESRDTTLLDADKYLNILKRLEQEPTVEAASLSYWSLPMSGANSYNSLAVQDTIGVGGRMIYATGGYTRVFHMQEEQGRTFAALPIGINNVMLSQAIADAFKKRLPEFSLNTPLTWRGDTVNTVTQGGIVGSFRDYRYGDDAHWIFMRLGEQLMREEFGDQQAQIVFRVKENMDSPDYRSRFLKEIAPHLDTDNMFIAEVVPYREQFLREIAPRLDTDNIFVADAEPYTQMQAQFEVLYGDTDKVNSQTIVVLFLLGNVFLGLIGTFWVRTRRRRSEIALRLAMGSTKQQVFSLLMGEGLLLLALVTLPAMLICYNVGIGEFTIGRTALIATWPVEWSMIRFLIGSLAAWLLIALMVMMGIWYPARQAMKIEPAEALHEE